MSRHLLTGSTRRPIYCYFSVSTALRLFWVFGVIWGELGVFYWSLRGCNWPSVNSGTKIPIQKVKPTHVLLIADPQIHHSVISGPPGYAFINAFRRVLLDINLRKNWHVVSNLNPHAVIFLGDMLVDGKSTSNAEEYEAGVQKFKATFGIDDDDEVHYIPGNEDVGLGLVSSVSKVLRSHYTKHFGPLNTKFIIANHTFIGIDAPGLVDEDYQRHGSHVTFNDWKPIAGGPISFVKKISQYHLSHSILLTHIPLSRSETASCGPHREKGGIRRGAGPGYQSMLGKQTTAFLLKALEPLAVFSADNRDYCDYAHVLPSAQQYSYNPSNFIREVTVKSFSMSSHITRPGFQLLSLIEPQKLANLRSKSFAHSACLLPDQDKIYTSLYFPGLVFTLLVTIFLQVRGRRRKSLALLTPPSSRSSGRTTPSALAETDPAQFSAIWSPFYPFVLTSPHPILPPYMRGPRRASSSTTRLVASLPASPAPSSPHMMHAPMSYSEDDGEDNDTMYPAQYATRRNSYNFHTKDDDEWSQIRDEEDYDIVHDSDFNTTEDTPPSISHQPEFISAPDLPKNLVRSKSQTWVWSYTFSLKGRRRTISLSFPSWNSLNNLLDFLGFNQETSFGTRRRQPNVFFSVLSVLWPALGMWVIINWTILSTIHH